MSAKRKARKREQIARRKAETRARLELARTAPLSLLQRCAAADFGGCRIHGRRGDCRFALEARLDDMKERARERARQSVPWLLSGLDYVAMQNAVAAKTSGRLR